MNRNNIQASSYKSFSASEIGTPEPILEWWPVKYGLKIIRKIFTYQVRSYFHKIMYPVRIVLFLSGWPLVYFLKFLKFASYCIYRGATYMLTRIEEKKEAELEIKKADNDDINNYSNKVNPEPSAPPYEDASNSKKLN